MPKLQKGAPKEVLVISRCLEFLKGLRDEFRAAGTHRLRMVDTLVAAKHFTDRKYDVIVYHGEEPATLEWVGSVVKETKAKAILISPTQKIPVKFKVLLVPSGAQPRELVEKVSDLITTTTPRSTKAA